MNHSDQLSYSQSFIVSINLFLMPINVVWPFSMNFTQVIQYWHIVQFVNLDSAGHLLNAEC